MSGDKHITINVLPQDSECWLFIMGGLVLCVFFYCGMRTGESENNAKVRIEQKAKP